MDNENRIGELQRPNLPSKMGERMSEASFVDRALELGLTKELLAILEGNSKYSDVESIDSLDRHSRRLRSMAMIHLKFMLRFGSSESESKQIEVDGKIYSSYPEYFGAWKLAGIPGILPYRLDAMIKEAELLKNSD
ncbi:hypothetical protein RLEG12_02560 (plasmid) [Rhizobium leguminosarum bv. trifolii CB782]|nr:hypothetical protein RLEG12_02560 [Rhizobium leguminosarum bv. trifolii CB782]